MANFISKLPAVSNPSGLTTAQELATGAFPHGFDSLKPGELPTGRLVKITTKNDGIYLLEPLGAMKFNVFCVASDGNVQTGHKGERTMTALAQGSPMMCIGKGSDFFKSTEIDEIRVSARS